MIYVRMNTYRTVFIFQKLQISVMIDIITMNHPIQLQLTKEEQVSKMHPELEQAAVRGDVTVLERILKGELNLDDSDFLSTQSWGYNFIQHAAYHKQDRFICKVFNDIKRTDILLRLLVHRSDNRANTLHSVAWYGCTNATKVLIDFYNEHGVSLGPPWKVENECGKTPLHDALERGYDEIACCILMADPEYLYQLEYEKGSPLFLAVENGCRRVIEKILLSPELPMTSKSCKGPDEKTALHQAIICVCEGKLEKPNSRPCLHKLFMKSV